MAVTFRQLLNRVLNNLGEDELSSSATAISSAYHKQLRNMFNHVKEEVENAHNWRALWSTETVTVTASSESAAITNANGRSRLVRVRDAENCELVPLVFDKTNASSPYRLYELDYSELLRRRATNTTEPQSNGPTYFALDNSSGDTLNLVVYPSSTVERTIEITLVIPQSRFEGDSGDIDTEIEVPSMPIELGVTWHAYEERGEELGPNSLFSQSAYLRSLTEHVSRDEAEQGSNDLVAI